jgi:hypothetical protein
MSLPVTSQTPSFLVTAPHRTPASHGPRAPWGTWHARADGAHATACGKLTATWFVFWDRTVDAYEPDACVVCIEILRWNGELFPISVDTGAA